MLYETRKISLFFFLARGIVSSLCLLEIQTLESSKARKSKDEEAERRTNKKRRNLGQRPSSAPRKEGKNNFLAQTQLHFSPSSLSLFRACVVIYRAQWDSERRNREMPRTTPPPGRTSNKLPADFGCVFFLFFFLPLLNLSLEKQLPGEKTKVVVVVVY
jgi:hypothetical protein